MHCSAPRANFRYNSHIRFCSRYIYRRIDQNFVDSWTFCAPILKLKIKLSCMTNCVCRYICFQWTIARFLSIPWITLSQKLWKVPAREEDALYRYSRECGIVINSSCVFNNLWWSVSVVFREIFSSSACGESVWIDSLYSIIELFVKIQWNPTIYRAEIFTQHWKKFILAFSISHQFWVGFVLYYDHFL